MMELIHLGGERVVTGSCHLLRVNGVNTLVDCGLAQGGDQVMPMGEWPVPPGKIDFLFLTHAHIDHIGRLPEIICGGFKGEIITTEATAFLLEPMLKDALNFSDFKRDQRERVLEEIERLTWGFEYGKEFYLKSGVRFKLGRAGHILGSAWVRFSGDCETVVFSGDIGSRETPLLPDPDIPEPCDLLVMESTYGDRKFRIERLGSVLSRALADGGKLFIPAFALGRSQELLYEMDRLFSDSEWLELFPELVDANVPVFLDSPLGLKITEIYSKLGRFWNLESRGLLAGDDHPLDFDNLYGVDSYQRHHRLLDYEGAGVIVAGSGMCSGGLIIDHLKAGIGERRNDILFVGYRAQGTSGRDILKYHQRPGAYVYLDDKKYDIRARVHQLSGYSAHADCGDLVAWVSAMAEKPGKIKLVHGDPEAQKALAGKLVGSGFAVV